MSHSLSLHDISKSKRWLTLLFAVQPCLDVLAYWTRNENATPAGYIRLAILVVLPMYILLTTKRKKTFLFFLSVLAAFSILHILNCLRVGSISLSTDLRYLVSVLQMPIYTVCFLLTIQSEETEEAALLGVGIAAALTLFFYLVSWMTKSGNVTYGEGLGYSGWVIDENRNANSTNFVIYACFCMLLSLSAKRKWLRIMVPVLINILFLTNGTKGCYFSIFVIFLSYAVFFILEKRFQSNENRKTVIVLLLFLCIFSAVVYPWTPRYKVTLAQQQTAVGTQGEIEATLLEQGIDITEMTPQERFDNHAVKSVFEHYYWKYLGVKPDIIDRFGMDRVLLQYRMSTNVARLIDARVMERTYAKMVFQDCDLSTRIVGFEVSQMGPDGYDGSYDLENDWHAILYYYGYLGFFLYICFVLYFAFRIIRKMIREFHHAVTLVNFTLLLSFVLVIGLAHFSGAVLRRPNVSIWFSLILALIYYVTEVNDHEAERNYSCL